MWGAETASPRSGPAASHDDRVDDAVAFIERERRDLRAALAAGTPMPAAPWHRGWLDVVHLARRLGGADLADLAGDLYALHGHLCESLERPPEDGWPSEVGAHLRALRCRALDARTDDVAAALRAAQTAAPPR